MADATQPSPERRINRTLTQKYDIHALRALQDLEAKLNEDLVKLYNVEDEDGLPEDATVDIISVYNLDADKKLEELKNSFTTLPPESSSKVIAFLLEEMAKIAAASHVASPSK